MPNIASLIGLFAILAEASACAPKLDSFLEWFNFVQEQADDRTLEVAKVLASRIGASSGFPVEVDQIKKQIQGQGLTWLEGYKHPEEALQSKEDAEAIMEALEKLDGSLAAFGQVAGSVSVGLLRVEEACRDFVRPLDTWLFQNRQLEDLYRRGQLEEEVRQEGKRNDAA